VEHKEHQLTYTTLNTSNAQYVLSGDVTGLKMAVKVDKRKLLFSILSAYEFKAAQKRPSTVDCSFQHTSPLLVTYIAQQMFLFDLSVNFLALLC